VTTPTRACAQGMAAGSTDTALRADLLARIALTMRAGNACRVQGGHPHMRPHDGSTTVSSALDDVHSILFAQQLGLPWERALTWDPEVFGIVETALRAAGN